MSADIGITALFQARDAISGAINNVKNSVKGLGDSAQQAGTKFSALKNAMATAAGFMIRDLANGLAGAISESVILGGQIETLKNSFEGLTKASGKQVPTLKDLREATKNMVSDTNLLKSANQALQLGLPTENLDEMMYAAIKLGSAMGIDAKHAVDSLTTGIGRQSRLVLDNLGIIVDATEAYEWYSNKIGVNSNELDENAKKQAWMEYAIEQVMHKASSLGDNISETTKSQAQWNASLENFKVSIGGVLAPVGGLVTAMQPLLPMIGVMAGTLIPQLITQQTLAAGASKIMAAAQWLLNAAMNANPIMLVVTAIGILIGILVTAYATCKPFRDAVNAVGAALGEYLKGAVDAVSGALKWLWDNILGPITDFLKAIFIVAVQYVIQKWNEFNMIVNAVKGALKWLWDNILGPVADFLTNVFVSAIKWLVDQWNKLKAIIDAVGGALNWFWKNVLKPVADFLSGVFKPVLDAVGGAIDGVASFLGDIKNAIFGSPKTIFEYAAEGVHKLKGELKTLPKTHFDVGVSGYDEAGRKVVSARGATGVGDAMFSPIEVTQYNTISKEIDAEVAGELAYRSFVNKLRRRP